MKKEIRIPANTSQEDFIIMIKKYTHKNGDIEVLSVQNTFINEIPAELFPRLESLYASNTNLVCLENFMKLKKLICNNCIKLVSISNVPNLRSLSLWNTGIKLLPELNELENLEFNSKSMVVLPYFPRLSVLKCNFINIEQYLSLEANKEFYEIVDLCS